MNLDHRKRAFVQLGQTLGLIAGNEAWPGFNSALTEDEFMSFRELIDTHHQSNGWFTAANIRRALLAWSEMLTEEKLNQWLEPYLLAVEQPLKIGIIAAGNIPMVGFHDVLSVLISGHSALIKLSSDDNRLIPAALSVLAKFDPGLAERAVTVPERLQGYDAVIATGSNNTSRYFNYYFRNVPHIIRKSRTSVAVLDGSETPEEVNALGHDVFDYFGLGCRNVSRLLLPSGYDMDRFFNGIYPFHDVVNHNKYANNYDYNKAVWLLNQEDLLDNGFLLLKKDDNLASPAASLYYSFYEDAGEVAAFLDQNREAIQCVTGHGYIPFGRAQKPELWDYADGVDTLAFLGSLGKAVHHI